MATKLARMVTYFEGLQGIKSHDPFITWSCEIMRQTKIIISPLPVSMTTKLGKLVTHHLRLLPTKSHDPVMTSSCKITWLTKTILFPPPGCLHQNWQDGHLPSVAANHKITRPFGHVVLHDKLKPLYLHYHNAYGHQIWQVITWSCWITRQSNILIYLMHLYYHNTYDYQTWKGGDIQWELT